LNYTRKLLWSTRPDRNRELCFRRAS